MVPDLERSLTRTKLFLKEAVDNPSDEFQGGGPHQVRFPVERVAAGKQYRYNLGKRYFIPKGDTKSWHRFSVDYISPRRRVVYRVPLNFQQGWRLSGISSF